MYCYVRTALLQDVKGEKKKRNVPSSECPCSKTGTWRASCPLKPLVRGQQNGGVCVVRRHITAARTWRRATMPAVMLWWLLLLTTAQAATATALGWSGACGVFSRWAREAGRVHVDALTGDAVALTWLPDACADAGVASHLRNFTNTATRIVTFSPPSAQAFTVTTKRNLRFGSRMTGEDEDETRRARMQRK